MDETARRRRSLRRSITLLPNSEPQIRRQRILRSSRSLSSPLRVQRSPLHVQTHLKGNGTPSLQPMRAEYLTEILEKLQENEARHAKFEERVNDTLNKLTTITLNLKAAEDKTRGMVKELAENVTSELQTIYSRMYDLERISDKIKGEESKSGRVNSAQERRSLMRLGSNPPALSFARQQSPSSDMCESDGDVQKLDDIMESAYEWPKTRELMVWQKDVSGTQEQEDGKHRPWECDESERQQESSMFLLNQTGITEVQEGL